MVLAHHVDKAAGAGQGAGGPGETLLRSPVQRLSTLSVLVWPQLASSPKDHGKVITRAGMRARIDFSPSGGSPSKWVQVKELQALGGAAAAEEAEPPVADPPPTAAAEEQQEAAQPSPPEDTPVKSAEEAPAQAEPAAEAKPAEPAKPAAASSADLSAVPADQKDAQMESDREAALETAREQAQAKVDKAHDPFKAAVGALKAAAQEDSAYKKLPEEEKAAKVADVIAQYTKAMRLSAIVQASPRVKDGTKKALKPKVDKVETRLEKLKEGLEEEAAAAVEERLSSEQSAADAEAESRLDEALSAVMGEWEARWEKDWAAAHDAAPQDAAPAPAPAAEEAESEPPAVPKRKSLFVCRTLTGISPITGSLVTKSR